MNLFDLVAKLTLDSSEYEQGLKSAEKKGSGFGGKLKSAMKVGAAAVTAVTGTVTALTGALVKGTGEVASYGDHIDKMSQKMGLSATAYQEWDAILQHSGSSIDTMKAGMKTLANAVEKGNGAFERIGLTMDEIAGMSNEELFAATIAGLQNVENETERTYLAGQLLGRGATELGALLNTSAEETEAMRQRVHELGGVMSDEAVKAAAKYQDQLQDMQTAFSGMKRMMLSEFMPALTTVMGGLTDLFSGGDGLGQISDGIGQLVDKIAENTPKILETGTRIVLALGQAITSNLPVLIKAGADAILMLGTGLVEQLPLILESGLQVLLALAQGIVDNLPTLIPAIVDVVLQIVSSLIDNVDMLVDASIEIIMALANGLIEALPRLIEKAPEIVGKLVDAIVRNAPKLLQSAWELIKTLAQGIVQNLPQILAKGQEIVQKVISGIGSAISGLWSAGMDIVRGIWQGISNGFGWIKDKISGWVGDLLGFFKRILKIGSPSKVFADQIGKWTALGIGQGFVDEMGHVEKMMEGAMPDPAGLMGGMNFSVSGGARGRFDYELMALLRDIRDNMDTDLVLDDGTLIGWMDKALGRKAMQRARGNA